MLRKISILYISQLIKAILPLVFVPLTISVLGVEKYGLVAFMIMLIGVLGIMDLGISGALIKTVSIGRDNLVVFTKILSIFFKILFLFLLISIVLSAFFVFFADEIYSDWLKTTVLRDEALTSIKLIGFILACVYFKSYLSSFIQGMEKQVYLAIWGIVYATSFYAGSYYLIRYVNASLSFFFEVLSVIALIDIVVLALLLTFIIYKHKKCVKSLCNTAAIDDEVVSLSSIIKLSLHLSGLSVIWVIATQVDKIALSTYSHLSDYANYQIAAQLAATVTMLTMPISQYLMPRLSSLYKKEQYQEFVKELSISVFGFAVLIIPIAPYFFMFGDKLISIWMMKDHLGGQINEHARWLVSAAVVSSLMNFLFITLYAMNRLKTHFYVYSIYSILTIPLSILVAKHYGAEGSAKFLFLHSLVFMVFWGGGYEFSSEKNTDSASTVTVVSFIYINFEF